MPQARLTKSVVESAPVGPKDVYLWDLNLDRFGLRIRPSGSRIYLIRYRSPVDKRQTMRVVIGCHGSPWTLEKAREEARKLLAAVDLRRDPFGPSSARLATGRAMS